MWEIHPNQNNVSCCVVIMCLILPDNGPASALTGRHYRGLAFPILFLLPLSSPPSLLLSPLRANCYYNWLHLPGARQRTHKEKPRSKGPGGCVRFYYAKADTPRTPQGRRSSPARGCSVAGGGFRRWSVECSRRLRAGGSSQNGRGPTDRPRRGRGHGRTATSDHASRRA